MGRLSVGRTQCWESDHLCKHNDNIVSAHCQKTMVPNSFFLIRVGNNRWEIQGPTIIIYWPSEHWLSLGDFCVCVKKKQIKIQASPFFFLECPACYNAVVTEIENRRLKTGELPSSLSKLLQQAKARSRQMMVCELVKKCWRNSFGQEDTDSTFPKGWAPCFSS